MSIVMENTLTHLCKNNYRVFHREGRGAFSSMRKISNIPWSTRVKIPTGSPVHYFPKNGIMKEAS